MQPLFTLDIAISEEQYRRGVAYGVKTGGHLFNIVLQIVIAGWAACLMIDQLARGGKIDFLFVILAMLIISSIALIVTYLKQPKRVVQREIDSLVTTTGFSDQLFSIAFFDGEMQITYPRMPEKGAAHAVYGDVNKIVDFGDFLLLVSKRGFGVYINKNNVPQYPDLEKFISQKCAGAKWKTIN